MKKNAGELLIGGANMYVLKFAEKVVELIWGKEMDIVHLHAPWTERSEMRGSFRAYVASLSVDHDGVLVTVVLYLNLFPLHDSCKTNIFGWGPDNYLGFEIKSVRALKGVAVALDAHAARGRQEGESGTSTIQAKVDFMRFGNNRERLAQVRTELGITDTE